MDPAAAEAAVTPRTSAIIPVHLYGSMADIEAISSLSNRHHLAMIEDCAHMHGGQWAGRGAGSWGDVGSFSFQQGKTVASGEGGICLTSDDQLAERIFRYKHIGYAADQRQGQADSGPPAGLMCHNYRATAFQAVILHDQLNTLEERLIRYNKTRDLIEAELADFPGFRIQARGRRATLQGYYGLLCIADEGPLAEVPRPVLCKAIEAEGISAGTTYGPVYHHQLYNMPSDTYRIAEGRCPIAEQLGTERAFSLAHQWLDVDAESARMIGRIFAKIASHATTLVSTAHEK
jgi:L-glutamine:2-deoxy-scyllo-inosose/3-amino-2,3-dideoxy-scyllo-inosose aminotransferase